MKVQKEQTILLRPIDDKGRRRNILRIGRDYYKIYSHEDTLNLLVTFMMYNPHQRIEVKFDSFKYYGPSKKYIHEYGNI